MSAIQEALAQCVDAAGGPQVVGPLLWPDKERKAAIRLVKACLSPVHRERFSPEKMHQVIKLAYAKGCTAGIDCLLREMGYDPEEVRSPEAELRCLMRAHIETVKTLEGIVDRIERTLDRMQRADERLI